MMYSSNADNGFVYLNLLYYLFRAMSPSMLGKCLLPTAISHDLHAIFISKQIDDLMRQLIEILPIET